jgi:uncharacterized LabA/DUF88 family protein
MNRVIFLIDGFNLYHSIVDIQRYQRNHPILKWLNIHGFCSSFLHIIGANAKLEKIYYFSAYAYHLNDQSIVQRHMDYIECLKSTGIEPILGRFKPKKVTCSRCHRDFMKHEEKETDVAISVKLLEVFFKKECDTVCIVTGDTDIIPAIKTANCLFPDKHVLCAFPLYRKNDELLEIAPDSFKIHINSYKNNQFLDPVVLPIGDKIYKPTSW